MCCVICLCATCLCANEYGSPFCLCQSLAIKSYANYFKDFKKTLSRDTLRKIYQIFIYIMTLEQVPEKFLKAVVGVHGLFEVRVEEGGNIYRIFCCMDEGNLVILFNGFQKKTQKTPLREIERAKRIMNEYFASKDRKGE